MSDGVSSLLGVCAVIVSLATAYFTYKAASGANTVSDKEADTNIAKVAMEIMEPLRTEIILLRRRVAVLERFIRGKGLTVPEYEQN